MRTLFHYTHKQTLGHTTRSVALATALCQEGADLLVLQGGVPQPFINFPTKCRVKDIPFPFDSRTSFQARAVAIQAAKRAEFVLKTAAEFSPDVFITEFFPFGRLNYAPELLPTLRLLRKKGTRIIASIGYPLIIDLNRLNDKKFAALHQAMFNCYDNFLIHTPERLEDPYFEKSMSTSDFKSAYKTKMEKLKKKIIYTGYIFPERMMTGGTSLPDMDWPTIVVSRGGGAVYPKIIVRAIEAHRLLKEQTQMVIACGPATTDKEMQLFKSFLKPHDDGKIFLAGRLDNLDDYLRTCAVSVSLSGYNTSVQMMRYGTPSVIVPYQNTLSAMPTNDQIARAGLLKEQFSSSVLTYDDLSAQSLADAIHTQLSQPRPKPAPAEWFNGSDETARIIVSS
jgi:predicted glycosyltransferase